MKRVITTLLLLAAAAQLPAQGKSLQRRYVPIVIKGIMLPLASFDSRAWLAFKYQGGRWQAVPFQVDSVQANGGYKHPWAGGRVDENDELVFMPEDLGDRAPASSWHDIAGERPPQRLEFEFYDQLDPARKGWLYLYKSSQPGPAGYHSHIDAPAGTAADTVVTPSYRLGHNRDGWIDYITLAADPRLDLLDRLKLRLAGNTSAAGGYYALVEDTLNKGECSPWPGPIRLMRDQRSKLSVPRLLIRDAPIDYRLTYYPFSVTLGVQGEQVNYFIIALAKAKTLRQSLDLSPAAAGMRFYSEANRGGVAIDGQADGVEANLATQTGMHWAMASGVQGTFVLVMEMPDIKGGTTRLYYRDSQSGGTEDGTPESGDGRSYGDMGLWAQANSNSDLAMSQITMGFTLYMLPERSRDASFADSLFTWVRQPLGVAIAEQTAPPVGVALAPQQPQQFGISAAWPNPVTAAAGSAQWRITALHPLQAGEVRICNSLGQTVRSWPLAAAGAGDHLLTWDLRDGRGITVAPGIYYLQVRLEGAALTRMVQVLR